MIKRNNEIFKIAAKKAAAKFREKHYASTNGMMQKIELPSIVIYRALCKPHNIRSNDSKDLVKY
ncbi:MAG: hypothetical protein H7Z70_08070 [Bacteroidia bacterium]|nr:hypothetical protein [Methylotenera sp.]